MSLQFLNRSNRVKALDFHPEEPWIIVALHTGTVSIWNYESQTLVKSYNVSNTPTRAVKFITKKSWFIVGCDDKHIHVYNYQTDELVTKFLAHQDYIRCIVVHPTLPIILSCADDRTIKSWDWSQLDNESQWKNLKVYEGHSHYIMQIAINPENVNVFASASLDGTVKVWTLESSVAQGTLGGHKNGVNTVEFSSNGKHLASGSDDRTIKVWDYETKTCIQTLKGHSNNVTAVAFQSGLARILSGSEDGNAHGLFLGFQHRKVA
ncbi:Coatomer subunit beta' [Rhizoclosmatium sp. JEL0117]|nr:Coatomer subunit beta' [Rhizoclosmatium sp. JEL0117]